MRVSGLHTNTNVPQQWILLVGQTKIITEEPVLKEHPIGHKNMVSHAGCLCWQVQMHWNMWFSARNMWSFKTGGLSLQWSLKTSFTVHTSPTTTITTTTITTTTTTTTGTSTTTTTTATSTTTTTTITTATITTTTITTTTTTTTTTATTTATTTTTTTTAAAWKIHAKHPYSRRVL